MYILILSLVFCHTFVQIQGKNQHKNNINNFIILRSSQNQSDLTTANTSACPSLNPTLAILFPIDPSSQNRTEVKTEYEY